jgi:hypothetical protein
MHGKRLAKKNLLGEGFKEDLPYGNEEEGHEEKGRQEEETLTNPAGPQGLANFLQEKLASATWFRGLFADREHRRLLCKSASC